MILSLAVKNIVRNRKNSLLVVLLVASITFIFFTGNSIAGRAGQGLRESYTESIAGEVFLQKRAAVTMNLFGANTPIIEDFFSIPEIPAHDAVADLARAEPGVEKITSQVSTRAFLDALGQREAVLVCGADPETYFDAFPGIIPEKGRFIAPGEYGIMITAERAERLAARTGTYPEPGMAFQLLSAGDTGFKIRETVLRGIFRYANPGQFMNEIVITDPQTARILASIQVASSASGAEEAGSFWDAPLDDLFGDAGISGAAGAAFPPDSEDTGGTFSPGSLADFLGSFSAAGEDRLAGGAWNFIILRLAPGVNAGRVIASLNRKLAPMGVQAAGWRIAAGISAIMLLAVQVLFNSGVFLVSIAGIIAAVNILLISVFRRTGEIGTLRTIGAGDGYIRLLVLGENLVLSCFAGILGVALGAWALAAVNRAHVAVPNALIASLLGGPVLTLAFLPGVALASFGAAIALGTAASIFPVEAAVRINPVVAVRQR